MSSVELAKPSTNDPPNPAEAEASTTVGIGSKTEAEVGTVPKKDPEKGYGCTVQNPKSRTLSIFQTVKLEVWDPEVRAFWCMYCRRMYCRTVAYPSKPF